MNNVIQIIAAIAILALGIWIGTLFRGCGSKPSASRVDTLVIDTSKIIEHTPIVVRNVSLIIHDTLSCESSLESFITEGGDTLSIGRVNSCKGILENVKVSRKPDTVFYEAVKMLRDTIREFRIPSTAEIIGDAFNFSILAKAGSGFGMFAGLGLDLNGSYGKVGLNISPSLYYIDKFRGFVFIGATYRLAGK